MKARVCRDSDGRFYGIHIDCPGCGEAHVMPVHNVPAGEIPSPHIKPRPRWTWNGDLERPTFSPSILTMTGHYVRGFEDGDSCWCTYNRENPERPAPFECKRCHSYVRDGRIQFLADCTHALAGQTVDLPEVSESVRAVA